MNINDFINWWQGFREGIDPANITKEHLDILDRKINGLQDLWDISLPTREETYDDCQAFPAMFPPGVWPNFPKPTDYFRPVPDIWCLDNGPYHVGTPQDQPHVGTPIRHYN